MAKKSGYYEAIWSILIPLFGLSAAIISVGLFLGVENSSPSKGEQRWSYAVLFVLSFCQ